MNLLSTATPAIGAWLVPIDQLKSSLRKLDLEGTLRVCAVMGCIMTEALEVSNAHVDPKSCTPNEGFPLSSDFVVLLDFPCSLVQSLDLDPFCVFPRQKKSIHIPIRSKYNRVTKRARYLHENPSCMLCNILHRYLQQADYSVIEEATMVSVQLSSFPSLHMKLIGYYK